MEMRNAYEISVREAEVWRQLGEVSCIDKRIILKSLIKNRV
jgi:hypothetical protein